MSLHDLRKWLAFGTGIAIVPGEADLEVMVVRSRPGGARILGSGRIEGYRERPAAEWGAEYSRLVRKFGAGHLPADVLLPRREVMVRQVTLPGVTDRDLDAAIRFQIDSLHPYPEDEAAYAYARIGKTPAVLVAIARRAVLDRYATLFTEAGIKMASFTFSAAALYSAVRLYAPPPENFLAVGDFGATLEVYGESPSRPAFSASFDQPADRGIALAASELRLPAEVAPVPLQEVLPAPRSAPAEFDLSRATLQYATALAGACPRLALAANLLPPELRSTSSRWVFVPTVLLGLIAAGLTAALGAYGSYENREYLATLRGETAKFEPQARKSASIDRAIENARSRAQTLDEFRRRSKADLDTLHELTRLLPPPAWLHSLDLTRDSITAQGEAEQSAVLLKVFDQSPFFRSSEFVMPPARVGSNEAFRIRAAREGGR